MVFTNVKEEWPFSKALYGLADWIKGKWELNINPWQSLTQLHIHTHTHTHTQPFTMNNRQTDQRYTALIPSRGSCNLVNQVIRVWVVEDVPRPSMGLIPRNSL
jgi:hypothetical protein